MRKLSEVRQTFGDKMEGVDKCLGKIPREFKEMISIRSVDETCSSQALYQVTRIGLAATESGYRGEFGVEF